MISETYAGVLEAKTLEQFRQEVIKFTTGAGFSTVSACVRIDRGPGANQLVTIDNTPELYTESYRDLRAGLRCPVLAHCKNNAFPMIWDQDTYTSVGAGDLWEDQAAYGYKTGVAMGLHLPGGKRFMFGVDRDQPLPDNPSERQRTVADLQLFAIHAQETAYRLLVPEAGSQLQASRPVLSPRELDALRWTAENKSAWDIGQILSISEGAAAAHLKRAMRKLDCYTAAQAVVKARHFGLIG